MISVRFQGKPFSITVIQVYAPIIHAKEVEAEWVPWRPTRSSEATPKEDVLFIIGDWNPKKSSRDIRSNRQVWPWSTKWSRAKANRVLPIEHTGHSKHTLPTTQVITLYTWASPYGQYQNQTDYILCQRWRSSIHSVKTRSAADWLWLRSWAPYCIIQT